MPNTWMIVDKADNMLLKSNVVLKETLTPQLVAWSFPRESVRKKIRVFNLI